MEALPVTLIVKAPNQQFEDQTVKCELSWSIRKLKGYLSEVYPCNPSLDEQKLIYSGQLLNDAHILKDILRQYEGQETHTVHLVFTPKNKSYHNPTQKKETKPVPQKAATTVEAGNGTRQRNFSTNASRQSPSSNAVPAPRYFEDSVQSQPQNSAGQFAVAQQMAMHNMMHQMYLQYLNHYARVSQSNMQANNNFLNGEPHQPQTFENVPFSSTINPQQPAARQYHGINDPAAQGEPRVQPQAPLVQNEDEAENRDWLDILYTFSRLIVLLSLVYFYSSPGRCSIVILVMVLYYFYQNHQRNMRERQVLENQQVDANADNGPHDADVEPEEIQPEESAANADETPIEHSTESETIPSTTSTADLEDNNRLPNITLLRTFVLSFFASLIPETPAI